MEKEKVMIIRESLTSSVIIDSVSMMFLLGSVWFNNNFIGGSKFINAVILVLLLSGIHSMISKNKLKFSSRNEAIKYLKKNNCS